ncbi:CAPA peptides-like isoform X2 [Ceratina calcarata]|uniref:CAPA peptides-like isoform X2 n=1 Tax=Ceratina calcarata TaxID=156304 RepID=A0AAJ7JHY1_9HYME|nr:CAPA peptides-like isoform X2 [Ceratina calcarata]
MRNYLPVTLVVLIFSTSLNQGVRLKTNDRRAVGLATYPRIGRSDLSINFNRHGDIEPETELYNPDLDSSDKDYEDPRNLTPGYAGRIPNHVPKELAWLISPSKDYRPWQKIDERPVYSPIRGSRNSQLNGYTPRLGRENDMERSLCK